MCRFVPFNAVIHGDEPKVLSAICQQVKPAGFEPLSFVCTVVINHRVDHIK